MQDGNELLREIFLQQYYENETKFIKKSKRIYESIEYKSLHHRGKIYPRY